MYPPSIFANSGKVIDYNGVEFKIVNSGILSNGVPYVDLDPENLDLAQRMCDEIRKHGTLTVRLHGGQHLVLGKDEFPYS